MISLDNVLKLNDWYILSILRNKNEPTEKRYAFICGRIDGIKRIFTSLKPIDIIDNQIVFQTNNNIYIYLGKAKASYLKKFPDAKRKLIKSIQSKIN